MQHPSPNLPQNLTDLLKWHIQQHGPVSIADYMQLCLQHEQYGYYRRCDPFGTKGDFITAPEISQIFGELVGAWLAVQWQASQCAGAALVELGPGRGTLMADILRATKRVPGFHDAISIHLVETSPLLRKQQWKTLAGKHDRVHWHDDLSSLPPKPLLLVANEFFDALPIRQFQHTQKAWMERVVALDPKGELVMGFVKTKPPKELKKRPVSEALYEYSPASHEVMATIATHLTRYPGVALVIDYGYLQGTKGDTLQAVRAHTFHKLLKGPGTADLSAHVNFDALAETARKCGARVCDPVTQRRFLLRLGAEIRLKALQQNTHGQEKTTILSGYERLTSEEQMGELFKVLCVTNPDHPQPDGF